GREPVYQELLHVRTPPSSPTTGSPSQVGKSSLAGIEDFDDQDSLVAVLLAIVVQFVNSKFPDLSGANTDLFSASGCPTIGFVSIWRMSGSGGVVIDPFISLKSPESRVTRKLPWPAKRTHGWLGRYVRVCAAGRRSFSE
ncbi:hypothetical protein AB0H69_49080, partial [Streptomyces phaeochromogenes]|uniref:hypothetical protein n=1 Tax=Streptomyces phaeochromogenes TaxID=1923 RepID=UPI0033C32F46